MAGFQKETGRYEGGPDQGTQIEALKLDLEQRQRDSDRGVNWTETISDNLEKDWKELKEDSAKFYDAATDMTTYEKLYKTETSWVARHVPRRESRFASLGHDGQGAGEGL